MSNRNDDLIICRCEEITLGEIIKSIREGARDCTGIKRRTRAGSGLCQGRTCELLVQRIIKEELNRETWELEPDTDRPPVRPIKMKILGVIQNEKKV